MLPIVLGVVGGILFLGLLILIVIKALFTMVVSEGYFFFICFDHDRLAVNVNVTKWGRTPLACSVLLCSVFLQNFSNF